MRNLFEICFFLTCFFIVLFNRDLHAQYQIKRSVVANGAGSGSSSSHNVNSTLGQPAIGTMSNNIYNNYAVFWYCGDFYVSIADAINDQIPQKYELFQNYPNPFNPSTTIRYALPEASHVKLEIYTLLGKRVTTLLNEFKAPGVYKVNFKAATLSTGFYIYKIQAGHFQSAQKMLLTK